jgi:hypothetical protein
MLALLPALAACGRPDTCTDQDCTDLGDCPSYECECKQSSILSSECITDDECCATEATACEKACADLGGWVKPASR